VSITLLLIVSLIILLQILSTNGVFEYTFLGSLLDSIFESTLNSVEHATIVFFITASTFMNGIYVKVLTSIFNVNTVVDTTQLNNPKSADYKFNSKDVSKLLFTAKLNTNTLSNVFTTKSQPNPSPIHLATIHQLYRIVGNCNNNPVDVKSLYHNTTNSKVHQHTLLSNQWSLSKLNNEVMYRDINVNAGLYTMNNYSFRQLTKLSTSRPELKNLSTLYSNYVSIARTDR